MNPAAASKFGAPMLISFKSCIQFTLVVLFLRQRARCLQSSCTPGHHSPPLEKGGREFTSDKQCLPRGGRKRRAGGLEGKSVAWQRAGENMLWAELLATNPLFCGPDLVSLGSESSPPAIGWSPPVYTYVCPCSKSRLENTNIQKILLQVSDS